MYAVRWSVFLKLCCRDGSAFGNIISVAIDLFFISKHYMIYSQTFSTGAKRALSTSAIIIPLQNEINVTDTVADHNVSYNYDIIWAKVATEMWF